MTDRRYGINKYGDGSLYGPSDAELSLAWDVSIDWDGDGVLESNEASRMVKIDVTRGRKALLQPGGSRFEPIKTGVANITFLNRDGRFDAWNSSSPLYPNVDGGKEIRVRVKDRNTGITYPVFKGLTNKITPTGTGRDARVVIRASDGLDLLRNASARVSVQQNIAPHTALGLLLDAAQWPATWGRSLDSSTSDAIPYWWSFGDRKAMTEIENLVGSFLGYFFVDAEGLATYVSRSSVSASIVSLPQEYILKDPGNPQPYEIRRNVIIIRVHPRAQSVSGVIWQLVASTAPFVDPGAANSLKLFASYTYNGVPAPALSPSIGNKAANAAADGSGADQTAGCSWTLTDFGGTGLVEVINNTGSRVYVRQLELNGVSLYEPSTSDITYPKDLTTVTKPRELVLDLPWQQDLNIGRDFADVMGPFWSRLNPTPFVRVENRPSLQFPADLSDIVDVSIPRIGISGESLRVGGIEHRSDPALENCQRVTTTLYLEPYISGGDFMRWDVASEWDTLTVFGV